MIYRDMINYVLIVLTKFCILTNSEFIVPKEATDSQEIFQYNVYDEFIINNYAVTWNQANYICRHTLKGTLAYFENSNATNFVAEYLAESDLSLNTLWVHIRKSSYDEKWKTRQNKTVDESVFQCPYHTSSSLCPNCTESRSCGAIVRVFHDNVCFVKLQCDAYRKFICRRSITEVSKSTHLDWIKIGNKLFKIFYERLPYDRAMEACTMYDIKSKLAVIETYEEAQTLGRFLLVGRPSKERVWIGARWEYNSYEFEDGPIVLSNMTESSGYPPWLRSKISKPFGCILLDRHLSNITYFVESSCNRHHSYMCYKTDDKTDPPYEDVCFIGDYDWRIYYTRQTWFKASDICRDSASTGRLPYIESQDLKSIIHVMETSKFDVLYHVWLGAYFKNDVWTWTYNKHVLLQHSIDGFPPWVVNKTHRPSIEKYNVCLNLDREDSLEAIFYGTLCYFPQFFICQYDRGIICNNMTTSTSPCTNTTCINTTLSTTTPKITTSTNTRPTTTTPKTTTSTNTRPTTTTRKTTTSTNTTPTTTTPKTTTSTNTRPTTTTPKTTTSTKTTPTTSTCKNTTCTTPLTAYSSTSEKIRHTSDFTWPRAPSSTTTEITPTTTSDDDEPLVRKKIGIQTNYNHRSKNFSTRMDYITITSTTKPTTAIRKTINKLVARVKTNIKTDSNKRGKTSPTRSINSIRNIGSIYHTTRAVWPVDNPDLDKDSLDYLIFN